MENTIKKSRFFNFKRVCLYFGMLFLGAILLVTYLGCEKDIQHTESEYSIEYDPIHLDKITPDSWLEIDGVKICHEYKFQLNKECCNFTVPSFKFIEFEIEGKQQISYMNKIDFSMQLYEKIFKNSKYYVVTNANLIYNVGIINFKRKDKKAINIRFSQDYPLIIR